MKLKLIYDNYHGNIELSDIEFTFLRSPLVNRLHQILQNSTAYLVFPCCKTSRFEHSLGAMDYSSRIFINGVSNSDTSLQYLTDKKKVLENIRKDKQAEFEKEISIVSHGWVRDDKNKYYNRYDLGTSNFFKIFENKNFLDKIKNFIGSDFIDRNINLTLINKSHTETNLENVGYQSTIILLNQSLRFLGLLHDIGHLPFSHLFEFALENAYQKLEQLKQDDFATDIETYRESMNEILKVRSNNPNEDKIHELIGKNITKFIFKQLREKEHQKLSLPNSDKNEILDSLLILNVLEGILDKIREGEKGELYSLYKIVSGTIDSDRLDFVQRDGANSGISISSGNIDRIIKMFCLCSIPETMFSKEQKDNYRFLPAIQSIHDVEEILQDRYKIYKFMVNHHAVKRSDHILQKIIEHRLITDIKSEPVLSEKAEHPLTQNSLVKSIETIKNTILPLEGNANYAEIIYGFFQLTDFWLLSLLNNDFNLSLTDDEFDERFKVFLSEIYENSRQYNSLWKRAYEFEEIITILGQTIFEKYPEFKAITLDPSHDGYNVFSEINSIILHLAKVIKNIKENKCQTKSKVRIDCFENCSKYNPPISNTNCTKIDPEKDCKEKYFYKLGKKAMEFLQEVNGAEGWCSKFEDYLNSEYNGDLDLIIAPTRLKNGIKELRLVDIKNQADIRDIDEVSVVKQSLNFDLESVITFFTYYRIRNTHYFKGEVKLKDEVGQRLSTFVVKEIKNNH